MSAPRQKISITVSPELVDDLDYLSARTGVSRSALISELLAPAAADLRRLVEQIPPDPSPTDARRFRGESAELIRSKIDRLQDMADDLFSAVPPPAPSCTCTVTLLERLENPTCPVHFSGGRC